MYVLFPLLLRLLLLLHHHYRWWLLLLSLSVYYSCCLLFSVVYFDCCSLSHGIVAAHSFSPVWYRLVLLFCSFLIFGWWFLFRLFGAERVGVCHRDFLIENLMNTCRHCIYFERSFSPSIPSTSVSLHRTLPWILDATWIYTRISMNFVYWNRKMNETELLFSCKLRGDMCVCVVQHWCCWKFGKLTECLYLCSVCWSEWLCKQHP